MPRRTMRNVASVLAVTVALASARTGLNPEEVHKHHHRHHGHGHHKGHHHAAHHRAEATQAAAPEVGAVSNLVASRSTQSSATGLPHMLDEILHLQQELKSSAQAGGDKWDSRLQDMEGQLSDLEAMLKALARQEASHGKGKLLVSHEELQAEIQRLRTAVESITGKSVNLSARQDGDNKDKEKHDKKESEAGSAEGDGGEKHEEKKEEEKKEEEKKEEEKKEEGEEKHHDHHKKKKERDEEDEEKHEERAKEGEKEEEHAKEEEHETEESVEKVEGKKTAEGRPEPCADDELTGGSREVAVGGGGIDVDMAMPYGELEPFGRENTAQELTADSIQESDLMVDQLERAEVAEEKRAVFRALTRLRGAAITSFDGIARAQTGNIDEYARTYQWRKAHPIRHLAQEESDVQKWAFPDGNDF